LAVLKQVMKAKGRAKVRERMGKPAKEEVEATPRAARARPSPRRMAH
jgi:hypothetical protein